MRVGILGTGYVGRTLGTGFIGLGHSVLLGSREPERADVQAWVAAMGSAAGAGTYTDAAEFGDLAVVAVRGVGAEQAVRMVDPIHFAGKVVIDTTNALSGVHGNPPGLFVGHNDSLSERIQRAIPDARVVKALNIVTYRLMVNPQLPGGPPDMFIAGDDDAAKQVVVDILRQFGWPTTYDLGPLEAARYLEPMGMVWITTAARYDLHRSAFKLLRE